MTFQTADGPISPFDENQAAPADLFRFTVAQISRRLQETTISARAVLDHYLERIERLNPRLNAFIFVDAAARVAADESDRRLKAGRPRSALEGIPLAVKDNLLVKGQPAVWGSRLYADYVPDHDELPVGLLRESGAVIVGKTNVPEFTLRGYTGNPVFGVTGNPWNPTLTPGGSSGGSVAAVAAGLVPLAIGTDGGGSIRRPAAHTGLVGLKPSIGRIPRGQGFPEILLDCEVVGLLGRTVADVRLALSVLAQPHSADQRSFALPPLQPAHPPKQPLNILFVEQFGAAPVDRAITASCRRAAQNLAELGHQVAVGTLPFSLDAADAAWGTIGDVGLAMLAAREPRFSSLASASFVEQAAAGARVSGAAYLDVIETLKALRAAVGLAFETIDVIMTPATAAQPWPAEDVFPALIDGRPAGPRGHAVFTGWVNACGHPALSIPITPAPDGMPIGLQLVGGFGTEGLLLDLAARYEARHPWADRWPPMALVPRFRSS